MMTRFFNITTLILALAAGILFVFPGCGGGGGGGSSPVGISTDGGSGDTPLLSDAPAGSQAGFLPDGTPLNAPDPPPARMSARTVGDGACSVTRAFSRTDIVSGGSVFMTFTLSGCAAALDSFVFSDNIPTGLTITTVSVTVNGAPVAYSYEPATATSTYQHWYLDDVPVDGGAEIPAGATFQILYKAEDPGTNPSGFLYTWPMYSWAGHNPATSNNVWGYADGPFNLAVNPPPLGASGGVDYSAFYVNTKAFDGDYKSWWTGATGYGSWDLYYGFSSVWHMDDIFINFYAATHTPANVSIYYSSNGITWTLAGVMPGGNDKPTLNINQDLKYIRIKMTGTPAIGYPLIRDVDWLPVFESNTSTGGLAGGPSYNQNMYFPSNAFDTDINSWWVGTIGTGAWDLYYNLGTPTFVNRVYVSYFNINYQPPTTTLKYSNDGITWTTAENFPPAVPPTSASLVRTAQYWKIEMVGNPVTNYPLIRTISYGSPAGASGGVNRNLTNTPDKAFDGDTNSVWMGRDNDGEWNLIYGYAVPYVFNNVKVRYHSAPYVPTTGVNVYTSDDGKAWTLRGAMPATVADPVLPTYPNSESSTLSLGGLSAKFFRVEMLGTPAAAYPVVLEIER